MGNLIVQDFTFACRLGCYPEEQSQLQEVSVTIKINFPVLPLACTSDQLPDTICYVQLCEEIQKVSLDHSFQTIEHLSWMISLGLKKMIPASNRWQLKLHKVRPPIEGLKKGVSFQIGDLI